LRQGKPTIKKILIGLGVLVILVGVGVFVFLGQLNDIVRAAIEKVGSDMTQTNVELNEVDIELTSGKGALRGFRVTNPSGFSADDAFKFGEVTVELDISTVQSDPVVIKELVIQSPEIFYEFRENGDSNLQTLNDTVQSRAKSADSSASEEEGPKIIIENLYLRDGSVAVRAPLLNEKLSVPMPDIHLTDIGKKDKGATAREIADQTMQAVLKGSQGAVAKAQINVDQLTGAAMEQINNATGDVQKKIEDATSGTGMGNVGEDAGNAIKGLLGK
jgi:uncharacterized protein involved in outer membrane biogenesis